MNLNLQDVLAILGPIGTLIGVMWYHFNDRFKKIEPRMDKTDNKIDSVEQKLGEKIDAVRDRVSRLEGQVASANVVSFKEMRPKRVLVKK
jgi:hypothetical protein